jgi:hypothetical protein
VAPPVAFLDRAAASQDRHGPAVEQKDEMSLF